MSEQDPIPQINIPGLSKGGKHSSPITAFVASPFNNDQSIFLGWDEDGTDILTAEIEAVGSVWIGDYGLDEPPGNGVWVFEGDLKVNWSKGGAPFEPQDYDMDMWWDGEWRTPTDAEMTRWKGFKPVHLTHKLKAEKNK